MFIKHIETLNQGLINVFSKSSNALNDNVLKMIMTSENL